MIAGYIYSKYALVFVKICALTACVYFQAFGFRRELKEVEDCGKRPPKIIEGANFNECLWDCDWRHNPFYSPETVLPFRPSDQKTLVSTLMVPKDLSCLR